jgi:SAM-dependent methyltransferase
VAPFVRQVVGIDLTDALLRLGGERIAAAGATNVLLQSGTANALPFVEDSFDLVTCRTSLHHFAAPEAALAEMARVCRPAGRVVVSDMVAPGASVRDAFDALHVLIDPSHVRVLLDDEIDRLMTSAVGTVTRHDGAIAATIPFEATLTDAADRVAVRDIVRAELTGGAATGLDPVEHDGGIMVTYLNSTIHATPRS